MLDKNISTLDRPYKLKTQQLSTSLTKRYLRGQRIFDGLIWYFNSVERGCAHRLQFAYCVLLRLTYSRFVVFIKTAKTWAEMSPTNVLVSTGLLSADAAEICDIKASREQDLDLQILPSIHRMYRKSTSKSTPKTPPRKGDFVTIWHWIGQKRVRSNEQLTEIITSE